MSVSDTYYLFSPLNVSVVEEASAGLDVKQRKVASTWRKFAGN